MPSPVAYFLGICTSAVIILVIVLIRGILRGKIMTEKCPKCGGPCTDCGDNTIWCPKYGNWIVIFDPRDERIKELEAENTQFAEENMGLRAENTRLQKWNENQRESIVNLCCERDEAKAVCEDLRERNRQAQSRNYAQTVQINHLSSENTRFQERVARLLASHLRRGEETMGLWVKNTRLNNENIRLQGMLDNEAEDFEKRIGRMKGLIKIVLKINKRALNDLLDRFRRQKETITRLQGRVGCLTAIRDLILAVGPGFFSWARLESIAKQDRDKVWAKLNRIVSDLEKE